MLPELISEDWGGYPLIYAGFLFKASTKSSGGQIFEGRNEILLSVKALKFREVFQYVY